MASNVKYAEDTQLYGQQQIQDIAGDAVHTENKYVTMYRIVRRKHIGQTITNVPIVDRKAAKLITIVANVAEA